MRSNILVTLLLTIVLLSIIVPYTLAETADVQDDDTTQYCFGKNVSLTVKDTNKYMCPFGHYTDATQARCISIATTISKFLNVKCALDSDCAEGKNDRFICENKKCVYANTREIGDEVCNYLLFVTKLIPLYISSVLVTDNAEDTQQVEKLLVTQELTNVLKSQLCILQLKDKYVTTYKEQPLLDVNNRN
jgi:hypothetical protein